MYEWVCNSSWWFDAYRQINGWTAFFWRTHQSSFCDWDLRHGNKYAYKDSYIPFNKKSSGSGWYAEIFEQFRIRANVRPSGKERSWLEGKCDNFSKGTQQPSKFRRDGEDDGLPRVNFKFKIQSYLSDHFESLQQQGYKCSIDDETIIPWRSKI